MKRDEKIKERERKREGQVGIYRGVCIEVFRWLVTRL